MLAHCGANVQKPTIRKGLTNEETVKIGDRTVTRRFGIEEDGIHYWQEDIYNGLPLTVLFRMASKRNAATYRLILDKVVINRRLK